MSRAISSPPCVRRPDAHLDLPTAARILHVERHPMFFHCLSTIEFLFQRSLVGVRGIRASASSFGRGALAPTRTSRPSLNKTDHRNRHEGLALSSAVEVLD